MLKISMLFITQVPLGVLNKDESTTAGMVEILVDYTKYVPRTRDEVPFPLVLFVMASTVIERKGHIDKKLIVKIVGTDWICSSLLYKNGVVV